MILIVHDGGFFCLAYKSIFFLKNVSVESSIAHFYIIFDYRLSLFHPISMNAIRMRHTQRSLHAESDTEDIIEAIRSHILYLNSTPRARGKVLYGYCGRLWYRVVAHGRRVFSVLVFCRWSCIVMNFARYRPRECYRGENKGRNRNE